MKLMMKIGVLMVFLLLMGTVIAIQKDTESNEDNRKDDSHDVTRVKIKVFRGPTEEKDGQRFAPWGFWIKQPSGQ